MNNKILSNYNAELILPIFLDRQISLENLSFLTNLSKYVSDIKNATESDYVYSDFFLESVENIKEVLKKERDKRNDDFKILEKEVQIFQDNRRKKNQ